MYGYIYLTTNLVNGMMYIGQHRASEFTESYKGSGDKIKKAFKKFGWDNFSVKLLKVCESQEELDLSEIEMIKVYRDSFGRDKLYNIAKGGAFNPHFKKKKKYSFR